MQTRSPGLSSFNGAADFEDGAGGFVAQDHGLADDERPDRSVQVVMHIAAANPDRPNGDADVVRSQCLLNGEFAQAELTFGFEDEGLHGTTLRQVRRS